MKISDVSKLRGPLGELMNQLLGQNGEERLAELNLWLKRVGVGILLTIDRTLTAEQAVEKTGRVWWHKNQVELDNAPISGSFQVSLEIFELDYEPTLVELDREYASRGLKPDLSALSQYICEKPEAADDRPIACQWGFKPEGTAACAVFNRGTSERGVFVDRFGTRWGRLYRFAGVREVK